MWGTLPIHTMRNPANIRWGLGSHDICFTSRYLFPPTHLATFSVRLTVAPHAPLCTVPAPFFSPWAKSSLLTATTNHPPASAVSSNLRLISPSASSPTPPSLNGSTSFPKAAYTSTPSTKCAISNGASPDSSSSLLPHQL